MPEAPEMQALAERLRDRIQGKTLERIDPLQFSALKTFSPAHEELYGKPVTDVGRRGKYVDIVVGGPHILFHLSQGGRVDVEDEPKTTKPKGSVARFRFTATPGDTPGPPSGPAVLIKEYGTDRKAGWWVLAEGDIGPLSKLGPEPDSVEFAELIRTSTDARRIHTLMRDQRTVAGLGRGYTDDILHHAKLSPYSTLKTLKPDERERLVEAIGVVLEQGLEEERKRTGGLPTKIGDHWIVHNNWGRPCPVCGDDLRRVSYESHEVAYCPTCQTGGKILADRRMSRLIR
jgi:formamidopyrimidine-DNA glycosylase